jgi:hypothetical protein
MGWITEVLQLEIFLSSTSFRLVLRPIQPPIQWILGTLSPGVKQPEHEADYLPPTIAEVKNMEIYTSTPHMSSWHNA